VAIQDTPPPSTEPQRQAAPARFPERLRITGRPELEERIRQLVEAAGIGRDADLIHGILSSGLRLGLDGVSRGDLKLVNAALHEFALAFHLFAPYKGIRKVGIFGSSRAKTDDPEYQLARNFASEIVKQGWMVITGAGPGLMQAAQEGAGREHSFGLNIVLPFGNPPNATIRKDPKLINFRYFFTRKVTFLKESDAVVLVPGGFGTLDEAFELLTLVQTGKSELRPVVMLDHPNGTYWSDWRRFIEDHLASRGLIAMDDMNLLSFRHSVAEAVEEITRFYRNYHSQRYVGDLLVLRLQRAPGPAQLAKLQTEFADLVKRGTFEVIDPLPAEVADEDALEYARVAFRFNRRSYGRLRRFVDVLNEL